MKKMELMKTIQLIVFGILAVVAIVVVVAGNGRNIRLANILLWISLALSFFFIFLDFNFYDGEEKKYQKLVRDFNSDSMTKVGNRYSIDKMIDKYSDRPLRRISAVWCLRFPISVRSMRNPAGRRGTLPFDTSL